MDVERVLRSPRLLRSVTSLDRGEFERLLARFDELWQAQRGECTHEGQRRQRAVGAGAKGTLPDARSKLLFILLYFRLYPMQSVMGLLFGFSQQQASEWVGRLTPLVNQALGKELLLPARRPSDLAQLLADCPTLELIIDGTERPALRPKDPDEQKQLYSGKKKRHARKNLIVSAGSAVAYLSPTAPGSVHDKKLADEASLSFPPGAVLIKDTGFQGYEPPGARCFQPKKKPRGKPLDGMAKLRNEIISQVRVGVEHVICGIKRCRIVAEVFRNWRAGLVDAAMEAACGLHNLRAAHRYAAW